MDVTCKKGAGAAQRIENTAVCQLETEDLKKKIKKTKPTTITKRTRKKPKKKNEEGVRGRQKGK